MYRAKGELTPELIAGHGAFDALHVVLLGMAESREAGSMPAGTQGFARNFSWLPGLTEIVCRDDETSGHTSFTLMVHAGQAQEDGVALTVTTDTNKPKFKRVDQLVLRTNGEAYMGTWIANLRRSFPSEIRCAIPLGETELVSLLGELANRHPH